MQVRTPIKSIRAKCVECSGGQLHEVRLCPIKECPLYPYRMGHRPKDEQVTEERETNEKS